MAKRKTTDKAQLNIRMTETLRRKIAAEAAKSGWSINSELVRRLERSFLDQGVEALIQSTAQAVAVEVFKQQRGLIDDLLDEFNRINQVLDRPGLTINLKKGEESNG
jgi:Arc-like DNA binding domain